MLLHRLNRRSVIEKAGLAIATAATAAIGSQAEAMTEHDDVEAFPISRRDVDFVRRKFRRREVRFDSTEAPGTLIVDPPSRFLYFILSSGRAIRYGIGVGRQGFEWSGNATIRRKAKWPRWTPPKEMVERDPLAAKWANGMPGGPENPLGARALYLFQGDMDTLYRIHGTFQPQSIGKAVSSGCIRMINADVADLYDRVRIGAKVKVLSSPDTIAEAISQRTHMSIFDWLR